MSGFSKTEGFLTEIIDNVGCATVKQCVDILLKYTKVGNEGYATSMVQNLRQKNYFAFSEDGKVILKKGETLNRGRILQLEFAIRMCDDIEDFRYLFIKNDALWITDSSYIYNIHLISASSAGYKRIKMVDEAYFTLSEDEREDRINVYIFDSGISKESILKDIEPLNLTAPYMMIFNENSDIFNDIVYTVESSLPS